jgi:hypothetical protein
MNIISEQKANTEMLASRFDLILGYTVSGSKEQATRHGAAVDD